MATLTSNANVSNAQIHGDSQTETPPTPLATVLQFFRVDSEVSGTSDRPQKRRKLDNSRIVPFQTDRPFDRDHSALLASVTIDLVRIYAHAQLLR